MSWRLEELIVSVVELLQQLCNYSYISRDESKHMSLYVYIHLYSLTNNIHVEKCTYYIKESIKPNQLLE